jgi:glycosyltransferase involved in cell wall biosynthesis
MNQPPVSIGIPTFDRPDLLARALESVARQDYQDLQVIVSDNASPSDETADVVASFGSKMPNLQYHRQPFNIGARANLLTLLDWAQGDYFMWLADDDEISSNYVSALAAALDADSSIACAMGRWVLMSDPAHRSPQPTSRFPSGSATLRAVQFAWRTDDAFFYGLHRIDILRQARFEGYWGPNSHQTLNWAFVLLFDVVLRGRVIFVSDGSPEFINHGYTAKSYELAPYSYRGILTRTLRRINVHALYWRKAAAVLGPAALLVLVPVSIASLSREAVEKTVRILRRIRGNWGQ